MILNTDTNKCNAEHQREDFVKDLAFKFTVLVYNAFPGSVYNLGTLDL